MKKNSTLFVILLSIFIASCSSAVESKNGNILQNPYKIESIHVSLGVPFDSDTTDDYLIVRKQYVLSYNKNRNVANWVAWELNSDWFGDTPRYKGNFITDTSLPNGFYRVVHKDYTNSGYDRGHMVMSEERTASEEDNKSTFLLTNILPQTPDLNQGVWLNFEKFCNDLALNQDKEEFIFAGGVFHENSTIGNGVAVPDSCWKIVVVLERGQSLKDINSNTVIYSVMMPNIADVRNDSWDLYKTTVRQIEKSTGYDFLSSIPKNIQDIIENRTN